MIDREKVSGGQDVGALAQQIASNLLQMQLENYTGKAQVLLDKEEDEVLVRGRVPIGYDEFGVPIMKQIKAKNEYDLMMKAGQMMLASGVLGDYVLRGESETAKKDVVKIPFKAMAERWYKVYKVDNGTLKPSTKDD